MMKREEEKIGLVRGDRTDILMNGPSISGLQCNAFYQMPTGIANF